MLQMAGNVLIVWSAVVAVASFAVHLHVAWWESPMGRHLFAYLGVTAAVLTLSAARIVVDDSPTFQIIRIVVFALVPLVIMWRLWLQIRAWREDRARPPIRSVPPGDEQ